jgi:ABC-type uncharacterized transport system permease subunit
MNSFSDLVLSLAALVALVPLGLARPEQRGLLWVALAVAIAGPAAWLAHSFGGGWRTGFATALWLGILVSASSYAGLVALVRGAEKLAPLLAAYLVALATMATTWQHAPERPLTGQPPEAWLIAHVLMALVAYGLLTLSAVAGLAVFLQERALKSKRPTGFTRRLPSIAEGETLLANLLMASGAVLAVALVLGSVLSWFTFAAPFKLDHKTVLSFATFLAIAGLLLVHRRGGISGRRAARYVLFTYLLLTLAYPGVKFVTDVIVG